MEALAKDIRGKLYHWRFTRFENLICNSMRLNNVNEVSSENIFNNFRT